MADDAVKKLEDRITRIEAHLSQQSAAAASQVPGGAVVDPAPWGGGGGGWGWTPVRWPHPVVDPAAFHRPVVDPAAFHRPVVDPAAFHRPGIIVDSPPSPVTATAVAASQAAALGRVGPIGDPPPPDFSRFSAAQLQTTLHGIAAEKARLDAMEKLVQTHLDKANKPG